MKCLSFLWVLLCPLLSYSQITVSANGNVGINEDNPIGVLQVTSRGQGINFPAYFLGVSSTGGTLFEAQEGGVGAGNFFAYDSQGNRTIQFAGQGTFYVASPGRVGIDHKTPSFDFEIGTDGGTGQAAKPGGGQWIATSDVRSKSSVKEYQDGLKMILSLNPVKYTYNGRFGTPTNGAEYVGLVAQEVQTVAPYLVHTKIYNPATLEQEEAPDYQSKSYEEDFLAVDPSAILYMLINAVQEQQVIIEQQGKQIEALQQSLSN